MYHLKKFAFFLIVFVTTLLSSLDSRAQSVDWGDLPSFEEAERNAREVFRVNPYVDEIILANPYDDLDWWSVRRNDPSPDRLPLDAAGNYWGMVFDRESPDFLCCFYNKLPNEIHAYAPLAKGPKGSYEKIRKLIMPLAVGNTLRRVKATSNREAENLRTHLLRLPIAKDPIVKYGLSRIKFQVIENSGNGKTVSSPTHFYKTTNTLYINKQDMEEYGYVVVLHEALHAALYNALKEKIISQKAYDNIASINKRYFSDYTGYVGVVGDTEPHSLKKYGVKIDLNLYYSKILGPEKAYAIGYTYRLLTQYYSSLSAADRVFADKFIKDVKKNRKISKVIMDIPTFDLMTFDLRVITSNDNKSKKVNRFIDMFTDSTSGPRRDISVLYSATQNALDSAAASSQGLAATEEE